MAKKFVERKQGSSYDEYHSDYYARNRARILAYQRTYYRENRDKINAYNNSKAGRERIRAYRKRKREWLNAIKVEAGCVDCGFNQHPAALQFDHRDPATKVKSTAKRRGIALSWSKERLLAEFKKCDVRCANCHAIRGQERGHHNLGHVALGHDVD